MFAASNFQRKCLRILIQSNVSKLGYRETVLSKGVSSHIVSRNVNQSCEDDSFASYTGLNHPLNGWCRRMSTSKGRSMRSKVEARMRKESGKTLREIRRAKKLKKKLMTEEERLIYNLKRAKKKVALLLQKLKKYDLPELPQPVHDPELLTPEQLQAYKKIGFKNKNYVPVGVRGVFGGVVLNMHLHWKFHETVQVCCDNFPKEKIKDMATMIARLSGGIVINIHNVKTIIMFRGRNYRQPKNMTPINTLTKRKALFKARFEQALDSQKLNIKKMEQQLRRMGVNPEDPVAMASIQRVASTFFNAIDKKEGSPYVFHEHKHSEPEPYNTTNIHEQEAGEDDSDQEELDRFIAEIEDAADQEWEAEEAAEREDFGRIKYWNREEYGGGSRRPEIEGNDYSDNDNIKGTRNWKSSQAKRRPTDRDDDEEDDDVDECEYGSESDADVDHDYIKRSNTERGRRDNFSRTRGNNRVDFNRNAGTNGRRNTAEEISESETMLSDLESTMWESDDDTVREFRDTSNNNNNNNNNNYKSSSSDEDEYDDDTNTFKGMMNRNDKPRNSRTALWELDIEEESRGSRATMEYNDRRNNDNDDDEEEGRVEEKCVKNEVHDRRTKKTQKQMDENWDSD